MSRATTDFQLGQEEEDDSRYFHEAQKAIEEYEMWLDSLPRVSYVDGNTLEAADYISEELLGEAIIDIDKIAERHEEEEDTDLLTCSHEEYEEWLDSLTSVEGNVAPLSHNCDEMFNKEETWTGLFTAVAGNVYNDAFTAWQARIYDALLPDDLADLISHIRQDEAYKCAELCEAVREQVAVSVDEHSARSAALCYRAIRTKRMGTLRQGGDSL